MNYNILMIITTLLLYKVNKLICRKLSKVTQFSLNADKPYEIFQLLT